MKLTKALVRDFESAQKQYGTRVAIGNLQWQIASDLLHDVGVKNIKTTYFDEAKPKPVKTTRLI